MKKTAAILLALLLLFLTACGGNAKTDVPAEPQPSASVPEPEDNPPDPEEPVTLPQEEVLARFASASELWKAAAEYANDRVAVTITDLDHNGRQELIVSQIGGTGSYSFTQIFEMNEDFSALTSCPLGIEEGASQPDLLLQDSAECWYDQQMDEYIYIFRDFLKISPAAYRESIHGLTLKNGLVTVMTLAVKDVDASSGTEVTTYSDEFGNTYDSEFYEKAAEWAFGGFASGGFGRTEQPLRWVEMSELNGLSGDALAQKLAEAVS